MFYGPKTPSNYNKISLNVRLPKESLRFAWSEDILVRLIANKLTPVNPFFTIEMVFFYCSMLVYLALQYLLIILVRWWYLIQAHTFKKQKGLSKRLIIKKRVGGEKNNNKKYVPSVQIEIQILEASSINTSQSFVSFVVF